MRWELLFYVIIQFVIFFYYYYSPFYELSKLANSMLFLFFFTIWTDFFSSIHLMLFTVWLCCLLFIVHVMFSFFFFPPLHMFSFRFFFYLFISLCIFFLFILLLFHPIIISEHQTHINLATFSHVLIKMLLLVLGWKIKYQFVNTYPFPISRELLFVVCFRTKTLVWIPCTHTELFDIFIHISFIGAFPSFLFSPFVPILVKCFDFINRKRKMHILFGFYHTHMHICIYDMNMVILNKYKQH